jgi:hypothetical protein
MNPNSRQDDDHRWGTTLSSRGLLRKIEPVPPPIIAADKGRVRGKKGRWRVLYSLASNGIFPVLPSALIMRNAAPLFIKKMTRSRGLDNRQYDAYYIGIMLPIGGD